MTKAGLNGLLVSWPMDSLISRVPYIEGSKISVFDTQKLGVWLFGFAEAGVLTYLRSQFAWWPFSSGCHCVSAREIRILFVARVAGEGSCVAIWWRAALQAVAAVLVWRNCRVFVWHCAVECCGCDLVSR